MGVPLGGRGPQMIGVYTLFVALTTIAIVLRVYTRVLIVKTFGIDDYLAVAAWAVFCVFASFALTGVRHGTGQHAEDILPPSELPIGLKFWWLCEPVYVLCNMLAKASIAVMLLRLTVIRTHRIIIWTVFTITETYSLFFFLLFIFQCQPSQYFWTQYTGGSGKCLDPKIVRHRCAGDWTYAILPYFLVWKLQMDTRSKMVVIFILSLGAIASTATIIRFPYLHLMADIDDFLYATTDVALWSCAETGLGITTACLATLRPLLRTWLEKTGIASTGHRRKGASNLPGKPDMPPSRRGHARVASAGLEEFDLGIRKTTRVSVDEFGKWDNMARDVDTTDGDSTSSESSKARINATVTAAPRDMNNHATPWNSTEARDFTARARDTGVVGSAWAEGRVRR
ncbi:uncharacterized protein AB675_7061 [Cyphellophora attinorum]|uniref:Rhodopsin domain-containing protein n=1 Tax=Cyphellophora attinorum TaxID=1664694 RepID=A0A0N1P195_9EURO|nr:uncharacterized protein AB675_7061 [Phialophora attinorum]KPI43452.1 hypothetical protein AB675_7061 [Phialophora attinorum]